MSHEIPTHLDTADRLMFGLTLRQVMIVAIGATICVWIVTAVDGITGLLLTLPVAIVVIVVTFIRPHRRGLEEWALIFVRFRVTPRVATWQAGHGPGGMSDDTSNALVVGEQDPS